MTDEQLLAAAMNAPPLTGRTPESRAVSLLGLPQTDRVLGPRLLPPAIASLWARWDYQWEGSPRGAGIVQRGIHRNAGMLLALWCA